jgi:hypothetical protein
MTPLSEVYSDEKIPGYTVSFDSEKLPDQFLF